MLKWAFNAAPDERDGETAGILLEGWVAGEYEILLPGLWVFEVANVLGLKVPEMAGSLMEIFIDYRFPSVEITNALCIKTFEIMKRCGATFYDAVYHAVAIKHKGLLVTADEAYYRKAKGIGHIMLLKDFR